ncbi:Atu4866 domain-containing protein [Pseudochelatococcus sp. B33]
MTSHSVKQASVAASALLILALAVQSQIASAQSPALQADRLSPADPARGSRDVLILANQTETKMHQHPYVGMWVTADGHIRQELLPNGRYDEARGTRKSAYRGRYEIAGNHINYWDDTGFIADGIFVTRDELHHGGMVFFREK